MMPSAEITADFPDSKSAGNAARSLKVELKHGFERRSRASIKTNKTVVYLTISALDESALKASRHSFERLLGLCSGISFMGGTKNGGR